MTNAMMAALESLIGEWDITLSHSRFLPSMEATLPGHASVARELDGAVVVMRQTISDERWPVGMWVIGADDDHAAYTALYSDTRSVQRVCQMSFDGRAWKIWREKEGFSQRFDAEITGGGGRIEMKLFYCENKRDWLSDFDLSFVRRSK